METLAGGQWNLTVKAVGTTQLKELAAVIDKAFSRERTEYDEGCEEIEEEAGIEEVQEIGTDRSR